MMPRGAVIALGLIIVASAAGIAGLALTARRAPAASTPPSAALPAHPTVQAARTADAAFGAALLAWRAAPEGDASTLATAAERRAAALAAALRADPTGARALLRDPVELADLPAAAKPHLEITLHGTLTLQATIACMGNGTDDDHATHAHTTTWHLQSEDGMWEAIGPLIASTGERLTPNAPAQVRGPAIGGVCLVEQVDPLELIAP